VITKADVDELIAERKKTTQAEAHARWRSAHAEQLKVYRREAKRRWRLVHGEEEAIRADILRKARRQAAKVSKKKGDADVKTAAKTVET